MSRLIPAIAIPAILLTSVAVADKKLPPIKQIKNARPKRGIFKEATRTKPVVIKTAEDASKHFGEKALENLKKQVKFDKQFVLVFAWRGSGQDKLSYSVLESFPEKVVFKYTRGRTRDLRPHVYIYVLRAKVEWRMGDRKKRAR